MEAIKRVFACLLTAEWASRFVRDPNEQAHRRVDSALQPPSGRAWLWSGKCALKHSLKLLLYADSKSMSATSRPRTSAQGTENTSTTSADRNVLKTAATFVLSRAASSLSPPGLSGRRLAATRSLGSLAALPVLDCSGAIEFSYGRTS